MHNYSDLLTEIDIVKEQIELTERELEYWFGVNSKGGIPLGGKGSMKFGANTSLIQGEKKMTSLEKLQDRLNNLEEAKERLETLFKRFEGLDYKIAYKRIIECKTHKEIGKELGYTEQYMKERWARIKTYEQPTDILSFA